jgi:hypothetical protein
MMGRAFGSTFGDTSAAWRDVSLLFEGQFLKQWQALETRQYIDKIWTI